MTTPPALVDQGGRPLQSARPRGAAQSQGALVLDRSGRLRAGLSGFNSLTPYDAADTASQEMFSWQPGMGSPDTEINPYRNLIVSRIRDLVRNDGWGAGGITRMLDNVIGAGFRFVSKPDWKLLSLRAKGFDLSWAKEYQNAVQAEFRLWSDDLGRYCDVSRRQSWKELSRLGLRNTLVEGDGLAILHWLPERMGPGNASFATAVQIVDPDRMSNPYMQADTANIRGGVEIDGYGAANAYHFRNAHPAEWMMPGEQMTWSRVLRETEWGRPIVVHYYESDRAGQHRAVGGILKPVLSRLKMLARYDSVELQAAIINAILGAWIESPYDPETVGSALEAQVGGNDIRNAQVSVYESARQDFHDNHKLMLNGTQISRLFSGEKMHLEAPSRPAQAFEAFEAAMLRNFASATGLSYEQVSSDWSRSNYSSARGALIEAYKSIGRIRTTYAEGFCLPIFASVLEELHARKAVPLPKNAPDFISMRSAYSRCRFLGPGRGWIDPVKEAQAAVLRMDAGLTTLEDECAEQGGDYEETVYQRAFERALFDELKLPHPKWFGDDPMVEDASRLDQKPQAA